MIAAKAAIMVESGFMAVSDIPADLSKESI